MRPNILFLFSDEHGFRYMGHKPEEEGGEPVLTPNLDKLASKGVEFTNTYCQMPLCTPSRMCVSTGKEVRKCGAWNNEAILRPELPTLADTLGKSGYKTCLVGKYHLGGSNQFGGFQHRPYGDLTGKCGHQWEPINDSERTSMRSRTEKAGITGIPESILQESIVCNETVSFLREHKHNNPQQPYFLCASFSRPHFPLSAPKRHFDQYWPDGVTEPKVGKTGDAYNHLMSVGMRQGFKADEINKTEMMKARAAYFASVSFLDEIIGDLLVRLEKDGLLENTIIIYSSDHGEMAGEHGVWWKNGWYEACTRVPFIISLPEQRNGTLDSKQFHTPVGLIDLFPTLCGLTKTEIPDDLDGIDLSKAIYETEKIPDDRPIFCDSLNPRWGKGTEFRMIRLGKYKYITFRNAPPLLFNLDVDPFEQHNLINSNDKEIEKLKKEFEQIAFETIDFDKAEEERVIRDGNLKEKYALNVDYQGTTNLFIMPDKRLVDADQVLYNSRVIAKNYKDVFLTNK